MQAAAAGTRTPHRGGDAAPRDDQPPSPGHGTLDPVRDTRHDAPSTAAPA
jgi:hypothetical protein